MSESSSEQSSAERRTMSKFERSARSLIDARKRQAIWDVDAGRRVSMATMRMWSLEELQEILADQAVERFLGGIILFHFAVVIVETDVRSFAALSATTDHTRKFLASLEVVNHVFFLFYLFECIMRLAIFRVNFWRSAWNVLDFVLVVVGVVSFILEAVMAAQQTSLVRFLRMFRLLRLSRILISFKELRSLVWGLTHCMKTLFWASGLIFLTLTIWSVIAVEYVGPMMTNIDYGVCDWCSGAFENVMVSNLTFFQIVSGDGWSTLARPIIKEQPWTAFLFVSVIVVVVFGLLNLIIAAIVDTAADARDADVEGMAEFAQVQREEAWNTFRELCIALDTDNSGGIGIDELREGLKKNQTLRDYFSMMEIAEDDMTELFNLLDEDQSGDLSYCEFHSQLYKMKTLAVKTQLYYVTRYVQCIQRSLAEQQSTLEKLASNNGQPSENGKASNGVADIEEAVCPSRQFSGSSQGSSVYHGTGGELGGELAYARPSNFERPRPADVSEIVKRVTVAVSPLQDPSISCNQAPPLSSSDGPPGKHAAVRTTGGSRMSSESSKLSARIDVDNNWALPGQYASTKQLGAVAALTASGGNDVENGVHLGVEPETAGERHSTTSPTTQFALGSGGTMRELSNAPAVELD